MIQELISAPGSDYLECHASTVTELPGGELFAAWFAGTKEGNRDVGIWASRRDASGWR